MAGTSPAMTELGGLPQTSPHCRTKTTRRPHACHAGVQLMLQCRNPTFGLCVETLPTEVAMDLAMHQAIARKLEAGKLAGWLSDYLVAWHGPRDELQPEVTVWPSPDQTGEGVRAYLGPLLRGLVPARGIVIAE